MRELKEINDVYPKTFPAWMTENDIEELIDMKWTSREYYYLNKRGFGTQNIKDAELMNDNGKDAQGKGYFYVTIANHELRIYLDIFMHDWDEEEQMYLEESSRIIGWD